MTTATLLEGNCLDHLRTIADESVHAIITDPPYGLANTDPAHVVEALTTWATGERDFIPEGRGFMGKSWDAFVPPPAVWDECMRVLKPGGHLLAFAGSRTFDLMTLSIRFAGFDIRDSIAWLYGSGFPKSQNISKALDKRSIGSDEVDAFKRALTDAVRDSGKTRAQINAECGFTMRFDITFDRDPKGWGCSLPTADQYEVILRVLGASAGQDVAALRQWPRTSMEKLYEVIGHEVRKNSPSGIVGVGREGKKVERELTKPGTDAAREWEGWGTALKPAFEPIVVARKPFPGTVAANVLAHGTGALNIDATRVAASDPEAYAAKGASVVGLDSNRTGGTYGEWQGARTDSTHSGGRWPANVILDESQAAAFDESRFFYVAKAPKSERPIVDGEAHPTVKPLALMRQLIKLVTPPGGIVVDPFAGSGTTLEAAHLEGFDSIGIEMTETYWPLIRHRIERAKSAQSAATSNDDEALFTLEDIA